MASEFSRSIATRMLVAKAQGKFDQEYSSAMELLRPEIDEALQEVREVLFEVIREHDDPMSDYGCTTHTTERARALMKKLAQRN